MRFTDFMLDIETLGKGPSATVVQIGICGFNLRTGEVDSPLKWNVSPHPDGVIDFDTVQWWMQQSEEARRSVFFEPLTYDPRVALNQMGDYVLGAAGRHDKATFWAMPPEFDCVILKSLYQMCGLHPIWAYNATRDLRTLCDVAGLAKEDRVQPTVKHDAGADARAQAETAIKAFQVIDPTVYGAQ